MIGPDIIKRLSNKYQTTDLNVRREYVQHLFLSYFYQQSITKHIYFKGGTALRILYHSPRFSEDLDFSTATYDVKNTEDAVLDSLKEIQREGIRTEIKESKKTSGGYLAIIYFDLSGQEIALQVEISGRVGEKRGEVTTIAGDFIPPYSLVALVKEQLVAEKIKALLIRHKPRDFYDLYFILRANLLRPQEKKILPQVLTLLKNTRFNFETELKEFLPKSQWAIIRNFKAILVRELKR